MKKNRLIAVFPILLIILLVVSCRTAFSENLLENPGFQVLDEDGLPEGWYTDAYITDPGYSVFGVSEGDSDHPFSAYIQNIGENDARFAQEVEVDPGTLYLLTGYIRADGVEGGHGANLSVEGVYAFSSRVYDTEEQWQYIEYYGETGPDQDHITVFARLGGYSGTSTGKAYFADLALTKVESIPGNGIADLWYRETDYYEDNEYEDEPTGPSESRWPLFLLTGLVYAIIFLTVLYNERKKQLTLSDNQSVTTLSAVLVLIAALLLRMIISWFTAGYEVDVNCFVSWGHTMAKVGPARFYEETSFCDYPPLYTYILAVNSALSDVFGGGPIMRIVFRFVPCVCDIAGCWILYRLLLRQNTISRRACFLSFVISVFNPATILNSAAWGQMDSVLCLALLAVTLYAVDEKWETALPLYVMAVLIKPQALMVGPLGLVYILITWSKRPELRKAMLKGAGISLLVAAAGVIPFSIYQKWDWLPELYGRTLASYPYATVNTANFYYLLGGNWNAVGNEAPVLVPVTLCLLCAGYGIYWYSRTKMLTNHIVEILISALFSAGFIISACVKASWAWNGALAMIYAFVIVLSSAVRSNGSNIHYLPWLGGLLFILLYVFGVKMHERYVFPAILLLSAAWILLRDRRILYVLLLFSVNLFINQGIVLDNSIRLGSGLGHLNSDTVWLADIIAILNIAGAAYAVWLNIELLYPGDTNEIRNIKHKAHEVWKPDRKLHWRKADTILLTAITSVYALISLLTLGSTKAPQTCWISSSDSEQIVFDLGEIKHKFEILYFAQVSRYDFSFSVSNDGENWEEETWAQMDQGQCWKWKYVTKSSENEKGERTFYNSDQSYIIRFTGRYVRLTSQQLALRLNEVLFREESGNTISAVIMDQTGAETESELFSDPAALIDEQDQMEGLPAIMETEETSAAKIQPSWWNSTYFDEIYHARTAFEFLHGTVPYETSHPPLGKVLMTICVAAFGMTPFGWRFAGALAGILMLPAMFLLCKQLTKKTFAGVLACLMMALDCMHLTQTQIATIDSFPVLFIIFAYFFMLRFLQTDFMMEKTHKYLINLACSGLFMGMSIASKWIGIYAGAGLAVLFFWHCIRTVCIYKYSTDASAFLPVSAGENPDKESGYNTAVRKAVNRVLTICIWCVLFFVIIPIAIYLLSYIPYMAYNMKKIHTLWNYINEVWKAQIGMLNYHSTPNLGMDHPFYSPWWEWPVIGKPMYYASQLYLPDDNPVHHSIFCFGNPVIWFGGLAALIYTVFRSIHARRYISENNDYLWHIRSASCDPRYTFVMVGLLAQYLPWVLVPRGTYIYHYFASIPFLMTAITLCFDGYPEKRKKACNMFAGIFIITAAVFFIILFPYASGMNVSGAWLDIGKKILRIWY